MDELQRQMEIVKSVRWNFEHSEEDKLLTDEEFAILVFAAADQQALLNKCRYCVIQKLIAEGHIVEVWLPFQSSYDDPVIRPADEVSQAHQSTNRI